MPSPAVTLAKPERYLTWAASTLGFALGGFFDGILLHQILQWHHVLSGLDDDAFRDLRVQILADGIFHALMYVVALVGLWQLWRCRRRVTAPGAGRTIFAFCLIGFGVWHVIDSILSHWLLGIHRIRMDVENRLFWDLLWFFLFGIAFIIAGWLVRRRAGGRPESGPAASAILSATVLIGGAVAALPPSDSSSMVMVVFRPGTVVGDVFAAADAVDGRLVWSDRTGQVWVIDTGADKSASRLYRHGALLVGSGVLPIGCLNWSRA